METLYYLTDVYAIDRCNLALLRVTGELFRLLQSSRNIYSVLSLAYGDSLKSVVLRDDSVWFLRDFSDDTAKVLGFKSFAAILKKIEKRDLVPIDMNDNRMAKLEKVRFKTMLNELFFEEHNLVWRSVNRDTGKKYSCEVSLSDIIGE